MAETTAAPYRVLARKYRPTRFAELIGQEALVRTLTNAIRLDRVAHAFLLTGVRGVGKTTTARIIARMLNCIGPDGTGGLTVEPCGVCQHCVAIAEDRHLDVIEMDAATHSKVEEIRELLDGVRYRPSTARCKVYIIDEVHMLSPHAFNALLKTLEEPPGHVKFVFATTELRKVPVTVLSRCQRFDLRRVEAERLVAHFADIAAREGIAAEPAALQLIARAADGSVRDGLSMLDQAIAHGGHEVKEGEVAAMLGLADRSAILDLFAAVVRGDTRAALAEMRRQHALGADPVVVIQDLLALTHWITRLVVTPEAGADPGLTSGDQARGRELGATLPLPVLTRAWQMLLKGLSEVMAAPDPMGAAEMVLIRLAHVADLPTPADLVRRLEAAGGAPSAQAPSQAPPVARPEARRGPAAEPRQNKGAEPQRSAAADPPASTAEPAPQPGSFEAVVALFAARREARLAALLQGSVHLIAFSPGRIVFKLAPKTPATLTRDVAGRLTAWTGTPWVVEAGEGEAAPTLTETRQQADVARRRAAAEHPAVRAVIEAFPGATVAAVRDRRPRTEGADPEAEGDDNG
ncbi:MAG: DNA polymerase III subunit gamma/tau [Alphaproteobacteria bacterium]|nr:DNA polymerase III subunit gamma/tau [Alphaproteobacteria bacterium]